MKESSTESKAGVTGVSSETAPDYGTTQGAITPDRICLLLQNERCEIENTIAGIHGIANVLNNELLEDIQSRDAQLLVEGLVRLTSRLYDSVGEVPDDTVKKIERSLTEPDDTALPASVKRVHGPANPQQSDGLFDEQYILLKGIITTARRLFLEVNEPAEGQCINGPASDLSCALDTQIGQLEAAMRMRPGATIGVGY